MGIFQIRGITDQGSSLPTKASAARSLCFDVDCDAWLEFHGEAVGKDGVFLDELFAVLPAGLGCCPAIGYRR